MNFRKLRANEIDCRVATIKADGLSLLLYKDARVDQNILDETVGAENWERSHELIGGNLYCTVSIWDAGKGTWIRKQDVGTESYTEKEKGQASDSFKRACFNWGIGRELYTAPFIWVTNANIKPANGGKYTTNDKFVVNDIGYDNDGNINRLVVYNATKRVNVYEMGEKLITEKEKSELKDMVCDLGYNVADIFPNGLDLTYEQYKQATATLKKMSPKHE